MSKTMKKVSALLLAILMIVTYMPMMQETAYAAKKAKKPAKVKISSAKASGRKITVKWKKAKNAKKYIVSVKDMSTKLTASKSVGKKLSYSFNGSYNNKYQIKVRGVNGKKKGSWSKAKTVKIGNDPKYDAAIQAAADNDSAKKALEEQIATLQKALTDYKEASATSAQALEEAQALIDAYEAIVADDPTASLGAEFEQQIKDLKDAVAKANEEEAVKRAKLSSATELTLDSWNPEVKNALNAMIKANANKNNRYVVFDFDNTCSIFDVEEQLAVYQLQSMAFDETVTPKTLPDILATELKAQYFTEPATASIDYCGNAKATYQDWIDDIVAAYENLYNTYGPFSPAGLSAEEMETVQATEDWKEFATKMRAMYDCVFDTESAAVAYPWVLYWFTGMTEEEVYNLAYKSHDFYRKQNSKYVTWVSPYDADKTEVVKDPVKDVVTDKILADDAKTKIGNVEYEWTYGTQVSDNIQELWAALDNNGIDVWVCSASATDPIRAAIDVWGGHDHIKGLMAMTNKLDASGKYINEYDWDGGQAWLATENGGWEKYEGALQKTQTQGEGKVIAIENILLPQYNNRGPIAGFMDSTGDFNFCTEFKDLQLVVCFNRASRKVTDGGGVIAELAVYQAEELGMTYETRGDDTLYVLQGREENDLRGFIPTRETHLLDKDGTKLWRDKENDSKNPLSYDDTGKLVNYTGNTFQYNEMKAKHMTTKDVIDTFAIKTSYDKSAYGYKYGFVTGVPGEGLGEKFGIDFRGYHTVPEERAKLEMDSWNPEVKDAINAMIANPANSNGQYVVFDFDNTCSIFDVEEQLAVYQLQTMSFDETVTPATLPDILATELKAQYFTEPASASIDYCGNAKATYKDWIDDIVAAYEKLYEAYGPFTPAGLSEEEMETVQATDDWKEFATKMRAMYDCVFDSESAAVAYPWVLYWFTGMTEDEVYDLAYRSHSFYSQQDSKYVTWVSPYDADKTEVIKDPVKDVVTDKILADDAETKIGNVEYEWTYGTQVSENIAELMKALDASGIDVWVCSASATDPIRAAIDVWGLHDYVTGLMAMTNKLDADGQYINEYDWEGGYAWFAKANGKWEKDTVKQKTQTQGKGKVIAVQNVLYPKYNNHGPIAGFMDSTGDFNFCTEFKTLQLVLCFNRASRKVTDGGGVIAELAVYQAEDLGMTYETRGDDTLYVLQGREENGLRGLLPGRETHLLDKDGTKLWRDKENDSKNPLSYDDTGKLVNYTGNTFQYNAMKAANMTTKQVIDTFAIKTSYGDSSYGYKYGFVYGTNNPDGLGPKFHDDTYNPDDLDFSGYHSQD